MPQQYESTVFLPVDPATAFALVHTLGDDRTAWDRDVVARMLIREHRELAPGALVFERVRNGRRVILEIEVWHPDALSSARLVKGPFWLADYGEGWRVRPGRDAQGREGSLVTGKVTWRHAAPVLADAAGAAMRGAFAGELDSRLASLEAACGDAALLDRVRSGRPAANSRHRERQAAGR